MKKRIACIIMAVMVMALLCACGSNRITNDAYTYPNTVPTVTPIITPDVNDGIVNDRDGIIGDNDRSNGYTGNYDNATGNGTLDENYTTPTPNTGVTTSPNVGATTTPVPGTTTTPNTTARPTNP